MFPKEALPNTIWLLRERKYRTIFFHCQNKLLVKKLLVGNSLKPLKYWVKSVYMASFMDTHYVFPIRNDLGN